MKGNINIWRILGFLLIVLFAIIFFRIVIYLSVSMVLFLIGYPISYRLSHIRIGKRKLPAAAASLVTLLLMAGVVTALCMIIIPPLYEEVTFLSELKFNEVMDNVLQQYPGLKNFLLRFGNIEDIQSGIANQLKEHFNASTIGSMVQEVFSYSGQIIGGTLCVMFITFFLLKDEGLVQEVVLLLTPTGYEKTVGDISRTSKRMLSRYFRALFADMFIVGTLVFLGLTLLGIKNAMFIAFCASILNVIPYIGSFITMTVALTLGISSCISAGNYDLIGLTVNKIFFCLLSINLLDGFVIQPLIYSNSVKAHPLEIFIVTLMAGTLGDVYGMVVALPVYTIIRIIAKEFLTRFKFFKRITDNIQ